ncbi:caspase family protein [Ralstonia pseudosolanacearum]|uniref:caspase family protein n=1 Tax=Ralstonia pseudosolanacearum TaxID=1310165 RepID=UPI0021FD8563|nr:caspase family protein [Ralstonia solanacearum]
MKRNALLIGNTGGLEGVAVDVEQMRSFLKSSRGGQWHDSEITTFLNPSKVDVDRAINRIRAERTDYSLFLFTGHGSHYGQTHLNLNDRRETLLESDLNGMAARQLSIFDCCRVESSRELRKAMEALTAVFDSVDTTRQRYEARIMQAAPQHAKLYSCSVGESSYDYPEGALYLSNLLASAKAVGNARWKTIEETHSQAKANTIARAARDGNRQTPQAVLPKALPEHQLILSIQ